MKISEMAQMVKDLNAKVDKFFTGKADESANAEKQTLVAQIKTLETTLAGELQTALANLERVSTELTKAQASVTDLSAANKAATEKLTSYLAAAKIEAKSNSSLADLAGLTIGSVTSTLAKQGINLADIPAHAASDGSVKLSVSAQYSKLTAEKKYAEAGAFYAEHSAEILAGK